MQEVKLKDWEPVKDIIYLNKQLKKLKEKNDLGDMLTITEWFATLDTVDKYKFFRRVTVLTRKYIPKCVGKRFIFFNKYEKDYMWVNESKIDQYVAVADFKHMFMMCGDELIMDYMKKLCRRFESKKGLDWRFIDSYHTEIDLKSLMRL